MKKTYGQLIKEFKDTSLRCHTDELDVHKYLSNNPDPFEVYLQAKSLQLDYSNNITEAQIKTSNIFNNKIKKSALYSYFFFKIYIENICNNYKPKSQTPIEDYIPLKTKKYTSDNNFSTKQEYENINTSINEIVRNNTHITLIGESGSGKSLTNEMILKEYAINTSQTTCNPIYIDLEGVKTIENSLDRFLLKHSEKKIDKTTLENEVEQSKLLFLIDGIDELTEIDYSRTKERIDIFLLKYHSSQVILNSRPIYYFTSKEPFGTKTYLIESLNMEQQALMISNFFKRKKQQKKSQPLIDELHTNDRFQELLNTPQNLTACCEAYYKSGVIPKNEAQIYENINQKIQNKSGEKQRLNQHPLFLEDMQILLEEISMHCTEQTSNNIPEKVLVQYIRNKFPHENIRQSINQFITLGYLHLTDNGYRFRHQAWMKYYTAKRLQTYEIPNIIELLEDKKWDEAVILLSGMLDNKKRNNLIEKVMEFDWILAAKCLAQNQSREEDENHILIKRLSSIFFSNKNLEIKIRALEAIGYTKTKTAKNIILHEYDSYVYKNCTSIDRPLLVHTLTSLENNYPRIAREKVTEALKVGRLTIAAKYTCISILNRIGTADDIEKLLPILKNLILNDPEPFVSVGILNIIKSTKTEALELLTELIINNIGDLGYEAAITLGLIGTDNVKNELWRILDEQNETLWGNLDNEMKLKKISEPQKLFKLRIAESLGIASKDNIKDTSNEKRLKNVGEIIGLDLISPYKKGRKYGGKDFENLWEKYTPYNQYLERCQSYIQKIKKENDWKKLIVNKDITFFIEILKDNDDIEQKLWAIAFLKAHTTNEHYSIIEDVLQKELCKLSENNNNFELLKELAQVLIKSNAEKGEKLLLNTFNEATNIDTKINIMALLTYAGCSKALDIIILMFEAVDKFKKRSFCYYLSIIPTYESAWFLFNLIIKNNERKSYLLDLIPKIPKEELYRLISDIHSLYKKEKSSELKELVFNILYKIKNISKNRYIKILGEEFA